MPAHGGRRCSICNASIAKKVSVFVPGLAGPNSGNLCADCADVAMEKHLSEERRTQRNMPSFRGMVQWALAHHKKTIAVKTTDIVTALKTGSLTVEQLLDAIKKSAVTDDSNGGE